MISVGDAINEPRYPSLKAIMGAKKKPLDTLSAADVGIDVARVGGEGSAARLDRRQGAAAQAGGPDHRGRGHRCDGRADHRLARGEEADLMADILVYALHYEGAFNRNSLGAVSEAARLAAALGGEAHAVVVGDGATDELCAQLGAYGAARVYRVEGPEGLAQPVVDAMARCSPRTDSATRCSAAACSASRSAPVSRRGSAPASRWRSPPCASRAGS